MVCLTYNENSGEGGGGRGLNTTHGLLMHANTSSAVVPGREVLPIMAYTGEVSPERGTSFRLQVYKRAGISKVEVYKKVGKSAN